MKMINESNNTDSYLNLISNIDNIFLIDLYSCLYDEDDEEEEVWETLDVISEEFEDGPELIEFFGLKNIPKPILRYMILDEWNFRNKN